MCARDQGTLVEACSREREQNLQRSQGRGAGSLSVWSQGEGAGLRRCRARRLFIVTTAAPAPSDRMALEAVVKRGFVTLVWTSIRFTFNLLFYYTGDLFSSFQYNIKAPIGAIVKNLLASARDGGDTGQIPGLGRFP